MKGKISRIKNMEDELVLPVTTVEAIYMEDGITKLSDEMKDVLKYEEFDNESVTTEIPSVKEEINGIKKDISEINSSLEESVKFEIVGEGSTVPPINGGGSYVYDDTEIRELINETNASLDTKANKSEVDNNINELDVKITENKSLTDSEISRLNEIANTWTQFKNNGGTINGNVNIVGDNKKLVLSDSSLSNLWEQYPYPNGNGVLYKKNDIMQYQMTATDFSPGKFNDNKTLGTSERYWQDIYLGYPSINSIGYTKLPNGLIMQWGRLTMDINPPDSFSFDVTLPIAFPTETLYCSGNVKYNFTKDNDHYIEHINVSIQTLGSDRLRIKGRDVGALDTASHFQVHWFAIGY